MGRLQQGFVTRARNGGVAAGRYRDGHGLILNVTDGGASWLLRYMLDGRRRDAGLGPLKHIGLAEARKLAAEHLHALKARRLDPIKQRQEARAKRLASATFNAVAAEYVRENAPAWKNAKHRQQWENTLKDYASPKIGHLAVSEITTEHVLAIIRPLWSRVPVTGDRVRGRIEVILDAAKVHGLRTGDDRAR